MRSAGPVLCTVSLQWVGLDLKFFYVLLPGPHRVGKLVDGTCARPSPELGLNPFPLLLSEGSHSAPWDLVLASQEKAYWAGQLGGLVQQR